MADDLLNAGQDSTASGEQGAADTLYGGQAPTNVEGQAQDTLAPADADSAEGTDGKAAEGTDGAEGKEGEGNEAPIEYKFELPEGFELNEEVANEFKELAQELKLPADKAQQTVDFGVKLITDAFTKQAAAFEELKGEWREQVVSDKEIGGEKLTENLQLANKTIDKFFDPEFRSLLETSGLGNHPIMVKGLLAIGRAVSEDTFVSGGRGAAPRDAAEILYGKN